MAASGNSCWVAPEVYKHHEQRKVCISRAKYREGRKARSVKVYTINLESCYVMVQGVPAIGVMTELIQLCALYGTVQEYRPLDEYPAEEFTEVYLVKFQKITSARAAKRHMDEKSFYGGVLHVCYVPEYETVEDTRMKLQDRRRYVLRAAHSKVRERELEETSNKESTEPTPEIIPPHNDTSNRDNEGESSNIEHQYGFPLLPLPPQEHYYSKHNDHVPTEDKMGTLPNAIMDSKEKTASSSHKSRVAEDRLTSNHLCAVKFVPRTTNLESRKRRMEDVVSHSLSDVMSGKNEVLIGPKLADTPKVDMEDDSLNTTVHLIRNAMKQVSSVPDVKPVEKKMKPRRRI
ncbi:RNA-binding protein 48 [Dunckerocampus dactyliophorus]|uniref:RNA-binding protein 48 n=1 Tax=Dunckerocampus dactyliophorus TaxID=161453 RepID=UPI002405CE1F|nr:RNA-binding protein 48 [Dunckerocampus dactyliophorus]